MLHHFALSGGFLKFNPETTALARGRFQPHLASYAFDHLANEGKTDAGAFVLFVEALEHLPNFVVVFRRDADAVVCNTEVDEVPTHFGGDGYFGHLAGS